MLPLRLCCAWTIWKAQGQTFPGNVVMNLSPSEKEHGLTYVAISRVKRLENVGIEGGLSLERLTTMIKNQPKMRVRLREEVRLRTLEDATLRPHEQRPRRSQRRSRRRRR